MQGHLETIISLLRELVGIELNQEKMMSDLNTAIADLQAEVVAIGTQMDANFAALTAALAANDPAATAAAVAAIEASVTALKAAGTRDTLPTPTVAGATGA
jgi:hypothetical protein